MYRNNWIRYIYNYYVYVLKCNKGGGSNNRPFFILSQNGHLNLNINLDIWAYNK